MNDRSVRLAIPALGGTYRLLAPITFLLMRVVSGVSLAAHGYPKLSTQVAGSAAFFDQIGYRPGMFWSILVGIVEVVGGLCLAAGFLTRVVAVPILIFLITAITYHWQFGFYWNQRGFEYPLFWAIVVFHFLIHGGGPYSVDARIGREV